MNDLKGIIEDCNKGDLVSDKIIKKIIEIIGQEKWQDLHDENNDICTTMGELIITLNGIPVLERKLEQTEKDLADYQFNYPTIKELSKENAELKEKWLQATDEGTSWAHLKSLERETEKQKSQLTKAKELLAKLLEEEKNNMYWEMNGSDKSSYYEVRKQAEQFLSDSKQEE